MLNILRILMKSEKRRLDFDSLNLTIEKMYDQRNDECLCNANECTFNIFLNIFLHVRNVFNRFVHLISTFSSFSESYDHVRNFHQITSIFAKFFFSFILYNIDLRQILFYIYILKFLTLLTLHVRILNMLFITFFKCIFLFTFTIIVKSNLFRL